MIIELKIKNIFSFKEETKFLMTQVKSFKELENNNVIKTDRGFSLLKTAAIYGANGSGKSNFIRAFGMLSSLVFNSFSDSLRKDREKRSRDFQFKLNSLSEKENTSLEVTFVKDEYIYRYGVEIFGHNIQKEWLYRKLDREIPLFIRDKQSFEINKESFAEGEKYKSEVNENVLFLSHLAQYNQPVSKHVLSWFMNAAVINGLDDDYYRDFTADLLKKNPEFKAWAAYVLKYLEIANIEAGEEEGEIVTYHKKYDENNLLIDSIPFNINLESDGTKKLIHILGPIYDTLRNGGVLLIDEFDCKLHANLSIKVLALFQEYNRRNAQLIFTAQDICLMDKSLLRRDQIWFTEKDQFGVSVLYSLSDFSANVVRNSSDFGKKYLDNTFGAADSFKITEKLTDLLYA
ncbi:ATP-binding protein [Pedobacter gandavensis]|uniref:AAA family ATPase n=1 Tax=Pedobacter gandavensis TaxID=2679963 RepID=UPI00292D9656|nr:ATP-binding protein [Pedobacter gandavensis]